MTPSKLKDPLAWLDFARRDFETAEDAVLKPRTAHNAVWHCQQAIEKALKALLLAQGTKFSYTHDLVALTNLLTAPKPLTLDLKELAELTQLAINSRYPGDWDDLAADEYKDIMALTARILGAIEHSCLSSISPQP